MSIDNTVSKETAIFLVIRNSITRDFERRSECFLLEVELQKVKLLPLIPK